MNIKGSGISDVGSVRANNEDYYLIDDDLELYIVCDGVGGGNGGEVASKMAAENCAKFLRNNKSVIEEYFCIGNNDALIHNLLQDAIQHSCESIFSKAKSDSKLSGMSTTLTAVLILNSRVIMGHVGDSRLYLIRNNDVYQVSEDHTIGQEIREKSISSTPPVSANKFDSILKRSIGFTESIEVDTMFFDIIPGDQLLLCSDGLYNNITRPIEFLPILEKPQDEALIELIDLSNRRGGKDNITCILIKASLDESLYGGLEGDRSELLNDLSILDNYLFKDLNFTRLNRIIHTVNTYEIDQGVMICEVQQCPNGLFIVLNGTIDVLRDNGELYTTLKRSQFFGQYSLMMDKKEKFSYRAGENCKVIYLDSDDYRKLCRHHPKFGVQLLENYIHGCESLIAT